MFTILCNYHFSLIPKYYYHHPKRKPVKDLVLVPQYSLPLASTNLLSVLTNSPNLGNSCKWNFTWCDFWARLLSFTLFLRFSHIVAYIYISSFLRKNISFYLCTLYITIEGISQSHESSWWWALPLSGRRSQETTFRGSYKK